MITCFFNKKDGVEFANFNIPYFLDGEKKVENFAVNKSVAGDYPFHRDWKNEIEARGGQIPEEVFSALEKIYAISLKSNVSFLQLFSASLEVAKNSK